MEGIRYINSDNSHGSHRHWKKRAFSNHGKVSEFDKTGKVGEFYSKYWEIRHLIKYRIRSNYGTYSNYGTPLFFTSECVNSFGDTYMVRILTY